MSQPDSPAGRASLKALDAIAPSGLHPARPFTRPGPPGKPDGVPARPEAQAPPRGGRVRLPASQASSPSEPRSPPRPAKPGTRAMGTTSPDHHELAARRREVARLAGQPVRFGTADGECADRPGHGLAAVVLALLLRRNQPCTPRMIAEALIEADGVVGDPDRLTQAIAHELAEAAEPAAGALFARQAARDNLWTASPGFLAWLATGPRPGVEGQGHGTICGPANDG